MSNTTYGYNGRILRVDLTAWQISVESLDEGALREYVGGTGLGAKILYKEVPPEVQCFDAENRIVFASGPLGGTSIGGSGTYSVVTLGALTNGATTSQSNGYFGAYLRFSGFDGIVIEGAAQDWAYLHVHDGQADLRDARHLLGLDSFQTEDAIKEELGQAGRSMSVAAIGPAGENLVRFAVIGSDRGHVAGHNGNGAVMGSKKLKAIAISRKGRPVSLKDTERLAAISKEMLDLVKVRGYAGIDVYRWGTLEGACLQQRLNISAVRNLQSNDWGISNDELGKWTPEYVRHTYGVKRNPCWACRMHHCYTMRITEGPHAGEIVEEFEAEGQASCGPMIGNTDVASALVLNNDIDRLGMDVNETGWLLAFLMECYEKGIVSKAQMDGLEMTWGNIDAARALVSRIARKEGFGEILAEGVMRTAQYLGGDAQRLAVYAGKGNAPRSHDHRVMYSEMLDTCVSNSGTIETGSAAPFDLLGLKPLSNQWGFGLPDEVASIVARTKGTMQFEDCLGVCRFNTLTNVALLCQAVNAATGWDMTFGEAMVVGRRAVNLTRVFNLRRGINAETEKPSARYGSTPVDGPAKGVDPMAAWDRMRRQYYELMGWDKNGIPLPATLKDMGLGFLVDDLPGG